MAKKQEATVASGDETPVVEAKTQAEPTAVQPQPFALRLRIVRAYIGYRSNEEVIEPGVYSQDDPLLFGLADYLLENGYAERYA